LREPDKFEVVVEVEDTPPPEVRTGVDEVGDVPPRVEIREVPTDGVGLA
jgi:hypothetical protein